MGAVRRRPLVFWLDVAVKVALVALLVFAVVRRDLPQFESKAVVGRALTYPIAALIVPAVWLLRGRRGRYPYDVDVLIVPAFHPGEFRTAYTDTLGDLALGGILGSTAAALPTVTLFWRPSGRAASGRD
jgi:hypothetical protein